MTAIGQTANKGVIAANSGKAANQGVIGQAANKGVIAANSGKAAKQGVIAANSGTTVRNPQKSKTTTTPETLKFKSSKELLTKIYEHTGEIGPTKKNAKVLKEYEEGKNPFVNKGTKKGADAYNLMNDLQNFDWTTGNFLKLTLPEEQ